MPADQQYKCLTARRLRIDDTTGIGDRDTLACSIPAGVNQVCLCAALLPFLLTSSSAYLVGCSSRNACPKQAENVGVGSVMPRSVPASFAVNPDRNSTVRFALESERILEAVR